MCQAAIRATGSRCSSAVIYLGAGAFATHCYSHATAFVDITLSEGHCSVGR